MRILGLSSATKIVSLGLADETRVLVETTVAGMNSERIMFYVQEAGITPEQIDGVAVAVGPGSYAGLRGGLAAAKSLAQTLNVPLVGVPTLDAIAYNLVAVEGTIAVCLDARHDEYNFALFGAADGRLKRLTADLVIKLDRIKELLGKITGEMHFIGSGLGTGDWGLGENIKVADELQTLPYGINVARLGLLKLKAGEQDDPLKLVPNYSHQPNFREYGV
ncbi:MAG: tRNA (adenosine(37)-N6)-threonylcarbamoyltransferase complex dimerization subunit type 1 TsaB [Candidatus Margulisiibacteriota bacterium]